MNGCKMKQQQQNVSTSFNVKLPKCKCNTFCYHQDAGDSHTLCYRIVVIFPITWEHISRGARNYIEIERDSVFRKCSNFCTCDF